MDHEIFLFIRNLSVVFLLPDLVLPSLLVLTKGLGILKLAIKSNLS